MDNAATAVAIVRRDMADGAIAGTAVGVVVAVLLLALCLYPVIVHQVKRRRRSGRPGFDPEAGLPEASTGIADPGLAFHQQRSSSESFKRDGDLPRGDLSRGAAGALRGKEMDWPLYNGAGHPSGDGVPREVPGDANVAVSPRSLVTGTGEAELQPSLSTYPFYGTEYMPESEVHDDKSGVLKGTSADYYSPSIPSEAFGMITAPAGAPVDASQPGRPGSRSNSLMHNVRHMFRRKSGRDNTMDTYATFDSAGRHQAGAGEVDSLPPGAESLEQTETEQDPTESPAQIFSAMAMSHATPLKRGDSPADHTTPQPCQPSESHSPAAQLAEVSRNRMLTPPSHPAPGTVNPMDVMPASTESEVWHRSAQQLSASGSRPPLGNAAQEPDQDQGVAFAATPRWPLDFTQLQHPSPTHTDLTNHPVHGHAREHGVAMPDRSTHDHLSPSTIPESSRHPSYPSDQSTPFLGPGSTDPSSHNTPSTQIDTPSPESVNSSEFRHSVSPQPVAPVARSGVFRCDEPGCNQEFDQPHKLKYGATLVPC